ncbi:tRNA dimethylallyltransferase [Brevundimonas sp. Leaf363]|uniref:tRNA (adenosine(37)-N6)-dimethylallyltransferase MiaA n=1 Tax=Brevundimonas sp. Leaf363 TaxID=1736353 RepID=UPI0006FC3006|nr:tRNA (adenosine(37)-N6)-dimethylallyltransferase MiaA [Brevundimonas sp. Leaf363]KQS56333.1 tRNA dimethylallyltransferase [Brevundimonas sp. Leaf363]
MTEPAITLIAGPTASGKSAHALKLARETGAVIINADSQQLYADLNVLSARPSPDDEALAEHRLYGVADAADPWSVGRWARALEPLLADLRDEGRPAVLVGGTGLYFTALTRGLADIPEVPVRERELASEMFDLIGEVEFRRRLAEVDPVSAQSIEAGDQQRLGRAWAVAKTTGRSLSDWHASTRPILQPGEHQAWVIEPDRAALYANCDRRVTWMVAAGALEEVRALMKRRLDPELPAMKAVGVRDFAAHLTGKMSLEAAVAATQQATRNYAKRQLTWFRNQTPDWPRVAAPSVTAP